MAITTSGLTKHGFLDIDLRRDLSNLCDMLPHASQVARLGNPVMIMGVPWNYLDRSLTGDDIHVGWYTKELFSVGSYGRIYKAYRSLIRLISGSGSDETEHFETASDEAIEVILKKTYPTKGRSLLTLDEVKAHVSESLLHVLAWYTMQRTSLPWAVPRPYEVFGEAFHEGVSRDASGSLIRLSAEESVVPADNRWLAMSLCMDLVKGRTLDVFLEKCLRRETPRQNAIVLLEILAQVAYILYHLQSRLRLNHRDVKVNNLMVRRAAAGPVRLQMGGEYVMETAMELTLIDFGFACLGCPPPRAPVSLFHASSYFPHREMCCKVGRDLAQLIFCIHCYYPLHQFLPRDLFNEVRNWMMIPWNGGLADGLHGFFKDGSPRPPSAPGPPEYHTGIYEFLRRAEVDPVSCDPVAVFVACCQLKRRYL